MTNPSTRESPVCARSAATPKPSSPSASASFKPWSPTTSAASSNRLSTETALRFATALEVTADELLQPKRKRPPRLAPTRKVLRRLEKIEALPSDQQSALLKTIDTFLKGAAVG